MGYIFIYIYMGYIYNIYIYIHGMLAHTMQPCAQSHSSSACVAAFAANPISTKVSTMALVNRDFTQDGQNVKNV